MMRTACENVGDDLAELVAGDAAAIDRHSEHLASCDDCRDARHEATRAAELVREAGADHTDTGDLVDRVLAVVDRATAEAAATTTTAAASEVASKPETTSGTAAREVARKPEAPAQAAPRKDAATVAPSSKAKRVTPISKAKRSRALIAAGAVAALAAGSIGIYAMQRPDDAPSTGNPAVATDGSIGKVDKLERAAADRDGGVTMTVAGATRPLRQGEAVPAGAELATDDRTRISLVLADGTTLVLDHRTTLAFDPAEPRRMRVAAGRIVADVAHVAQRPASITTPTGTIDVVGTRFSVTATDTLTTVQVIRGSVVLGETTHGVKKEVRAGEEGLIDRGVLTVSAAPGLSREVEWSELGATATGDTTTSGIGSLRAYKPGEKRDRDWNLALASHDVKVRIVGPIARTEITEVFRNDADQTLEGVYQFPLPPDAQIDSLSLDVEGGFVDGAFLDKQRAAKIWRGVIDKATPKVRQRPESDIIWVQGPWRDPALLDWKRGGRFELRIFPIPAKGARTIKIAYTQVVTPRGPWRQYVYPLPHSTDGSTVADKFSVDVEVRGAAPGRIRTAGYQLARDPSRTGLEALTLAQTAFVPRGDLVIDYRAADGDAELRAWTFAGGAAVPPDEKLAKKKNVGIDPEVVAAQRAIAGDVRPTAVLALKPELPRWDEAKPRDYMIVIDSSQSMAGERFTRASRLAVAMVAEMDRRDQFSVATCDLDCRRFAGGMRTPSAGAATDLEAWLATQTQAGASDVVGAIRQASADAGRGTDREHWVIYIGDGFSTTGFRRAGDVERALAATTGDQLRVSAVGVGSDADEAVLSAVARGGGGSYLAWVPGQAIGSAAIAALESTYGSALRDATIELPAGLADVAPTVLPTIRAGEEALIAARITGEVSGDVIVRGTVAGQPYEQRYPVKLAVSTAPGNGFVPRLWASLAIEQLERDSRGDDRPRIVALSQAFGVMSKETSLLVLESAAMFDAFGVDRSQPTQKWTGEEALDEVTATGKVAMNKPTDSDDAAEKEDAPAKKAKSVTFGLDLAGGADVGGGTGAALGDRAPASSTRSADPAMPGALRSTSAGRGRGGMIAMRRTWVRVPSLSPYDAVAPGITQAIAEAEAELDANPDSRERHRNLVQALAYAGEIGRARDVAASWLERDKLDGQALGYQADLLGRDGQRDLALRTLSGLVDLDPDHVALHERMVRTFENAGRIAHACSHRIALSGIQFKNARVAGRAIRCLRGIGRDRDAELILRGLPDDAQRTAAEKAATIAPSAPRISGDLVVNATWTGNADLDVSLVTPTGTRVSWMGGRTDVFAADATSTARERLAIRRLRRGNYLLEVTRNGQAGGQVGDTIRGTLDVTVLGTKRSLPFELTGSRAVIGRLAINLEERLEQVWNDGMGSFAPMGRVTFGAISDPFVARVVRSRAAVFRACYQRQLQRSAASRGTVAVVIDFDANGQVSNARATSPSGLRETARCVEQQVRRMRFPIDLQGNRVVVQMNFAIQ